MGEAEHPFVLLVRHELDPGVGHDTRHGGRVPAPEAEHSILTVGLGQELDRALESVVLVRVGLEVDLGPVQGRDHRLGHRAGRGPGGRAREDAPTVRDLDEKNKVTNV